MAVENIAKALGDESRRKIIELLKEGELPATAIFDQFEYAAPTISRHLSVLKDAGLVSTRRNGVFIYYQCSSLFNVNCNVIGKIDGVYCDICCY